MRIFVGIDLAAEMRTRIARFVEGVQELSPDARWMRPESLHVTLKFIGEQTSEQIAAIAERLRGIEAATFEIRAGGFGFFPTAKAARVFWIGIHAGPQLAKLAETIDVRVAESGVAREERAYSPHLTLARGGGRSGAPQRKKGDRPNTVFAALQKRLDAMKEIDFGTMMASEFILYQSQLSPAGSKYTALQRFELHESARV